MRTPTRLLLTALSAVPTLAIAADVSMVSGLYKKSESEFNGNDAGGISTIEVGGRYGDMIDGHLGWFGQALLAMRSYDAPSGVDEPSDSTSLSLGGGVRYIGKRWNESAIPFLWGMGAYRNEKTAEIAGAVYRETETNGLFYSGGVGLRLTVDSNFFVDLETPLFESALFATSKTKTPATPPATGSTEEEETRNELYAKTYAPFSSLVVSLGVKL
jgi:hypothetical protein